MMEAKEEMWNLYLGFTFIFHFYFACFLFLEELFCVILAEEILDSRKIVYFL